MTEQTKQVGGQGRVMDGCSAWWLTGWQRKWRSESFATSMTIDHTRDRLWKAEGRYQSDNGFGEHAPSKEACGETCRAPGGKPRVEFVEPTENPKAVSEWIRRVQEEMGRTVGIPKEMMEPRKRGLIERTCDRVFGRWW